MLFYSSMFRNIVSSLFFEKTFNVSFFLCFNRFFVVVIFSFTFGTKKTTICFFSVGDPSVLCVGSGSHWTSFGHRPDPDALDLDEIVEDMLLEEEAEAWRVSAFRGPEIDDEIRMEIEIHHCFFCWKIYLFGKMDSL